MRCIRSDFLVVVDDCPQTADFVKQDVNTINFFSPPKVGGKGRLIAEFANAVGARCLFSKYQAGWTNLI